MHPPFAVKVEKLSKLYRLDARAQTNPTLRDAIVEKLARLNPLRGAHNGTRPTQTELWALHEVAFEVQPGEVVGVIGRNGAGKSTLLKILSRITEPTRGRAEIYGRVGSLLEVGAGFHPELSGRENIFLNGSILGLTRREIESKFDEIVAFAEVEQFVDTPVKRYSSGMYLRLAFAVAAHLEPEILLIDEVLTVGDAAFQKKCLGKMSDVARHGRTILFVSHNTAAMLNFCTRGLLLEKGRLTADGDIEQVVRNYHAGLQAGVTHDLASYKDRQGRGRVRFTHIRFEDENGRPTEHGISGRPLTIVLEYKSTGTRQLPNCRVSVACADVLGQILFNLSSELVIRDPIDLPAQGSIRCVIPKLPLSGSQYRLWLYFEVNREIEDWVQHAVELNVVDGDFYGTGRIYPPGWQGKGVLVPHEWSIRE